MGTAVDINHGGIFFRRVEVVWLYHAVIQVGGAVGGLNAAALEDGLLVVCPRIGSAQQSLNFEV